MNTAVAQLIYIAGQKLVAAGSNMPIELNKTLNSFLEWPFKVASGSAIDSTGLKTDIFSTLIYTSTNHVTENDPVEVQANNMACIIDASESINLNSLRSTYKRIAEAKKLQKSAPPGANNTVRTETLGIILAINSENTLEEIAAEFQHLNQQTPSSEWPDIIAIISQGTISFAVQFPGESTRSEFLLPGKEVVSNCAPALYVIPIISPSGAHTFNKICSVLFMHLSAFSPGTKFPTREQILEGAPRVNISLAGYQFNLNGVLAPVPEHFYIGRYVPQRPHQTAQKILRNSISAMAKRWSNIAKRRHCTSTTISVHDR